MGNIHGTVLQIFQDQSTKQPNLSNALSPQVFQQQPADRPNPDNAFISQNIQPGARNQATRRAEPQHDADRKPYAHMFLDESVEDWDGDSEAKMDSNEKLYDGMIFDDMNEKIENLVDELVVKMNKVSRFTWDSDEYTHAHFLHAEDTW